MTDPKLRVVITSACSQCGAPWPKDGPTCDCLANWRSFGCAVMAFMVTCYVAVAAAIAYGLVKVISEV